MTTIAIVAAMDLNRVIGDGNDLPWHIPQELRRFKRLTIGKACIMGRATAKSIGHPLSSRGNIVLTQNYYLQTKKKININLYANKFVYTGDISSALQLARQYNRSKGVTEICIIGGSSIFRQTISIVNKIYLTVIHHRFEVTNPCTFPDIPPKFKLIDTGTIPCEDFKITTETYMI